MIVISNLDVWLLTSRNVQPGAGNQDMYNTLVGYARHGWQVHLLTDSRAVEGMPVIHENVFCHRKPIWFLQAGKAVRRRLRSLLGCRPPSGVRQGGLSPGWSGI